MARFGEGNTVAQKAVKAKTASDAASDAGRVEHVGRQRRVAAGKAARAQAPLQSQAVFEAGPSRVDPVTLLLAQAQSRVPELVPIRHGRMLVSPFTYYRGAALPMAADLASTTSSGLRVQLCGDAHLSNFGMFASPERHLIFDVNDFDETLPGPFEWDVKRLAASFAVAGRDNGIAKKDRRKIVLAGVAAYRTAMQEFAAKSELDVWYAHLDVDDLFAQLKTQATKVQKKTASGWLAKARAQDSMRALDKLTTEVDGKRQIISDPPLIVPVGELFPDTEAQALNDQLRALVAKYRLTLQSDRRHLLERFKLTQVARKVVGVGSVGTRAWILLMEADDGVDPLFLQAKEAQPSVLAEYAGRSKYTNHGQRVVAGQHLMQSASDIFLGWQRVPGVDGVSRDYYVRQLRDWKFSFPIEQMALAGLTTYAQTCAWTLARAHARSGDRIAIAAYLGSSDQFDNAIADFAEIYADQNEADHAALQAAVAEGRVEAQTGL